MCISTVCVDAGVAACVLCLNVFLPNMSPSGGEHYNVQPEAPDVKLAFNGFQWLSMAFNDFQRLSMAFNDFQWEYTLYK